MPASNVVFEQGLRAHQAGRFDEAATLYRRVIETDRAHAPAWYQLGVIAAQAGRFDDAVGAFEKALTLQPSVARFHADLGAAFACLGRLDEAVAAFQTALRLGPADAELHYNLGTALAGLGRFAEAELNFREVLRAAPDMPEGYNNLGRVLASLGRFEEAAVLYGEALRRQPRWAEAYVNLAQAWEGLGRLDSAEQSYRDALVAEPVPAIQNALGNLLVRMGRPGEAEGVYRAILQAHPDISEVHGNLGAALMMQSRNAEARVSLERAAALDPDNGYAQFGLCAAELPAVYADESEIAPARDAYRGRLQALADRFARGRIGAATLARGIGAGSPFYLAYQARNDRDLQRLRGDLVCRVLADAFPPPPHRAIDRAGKIRVGVVTGFFRHHSVWKIPVRGWLEKLDRSRFELFGYHTDSVQDEATTMAARLCGRFVRGPLSLEGWRAEIARDAPHVLLYPEIGMDPMSAQLGALRLAPVQCNSWGHPETSGYPTLDYYLSSELMEPPDGQDHYTETLVRLPNLSFYLEPETRAPAAIRRHDLGLRESAIIYWCCQSIYKYLPQSDHVLPRIAREVGDCQFTFIESPDGPHITGLFQRRLEHAFAAFGLRAKEHCVFLPRLAPDRFAAALAASDVFLNSIDWSGANSVMESLAFDLPIVTTRTGLMRGRHADGILRMMDVTDTIAEDLDGYVAIAARLAKDGAWRRAIREKIAARKGAIYRDAACIRGLEEFLIGAVAKAREPLR